MENVDEAIFYPEVNNVGGSLGVIIPKDVVNLLGLQPKDQIKVTVKFVKRANNGDN